MLGSEEDMSPEYQQHCLELAKVRLRSVMRELVTLSPKWTRTVLQDEDGEQLLDSSLDELSLLKTHRRADDAYRRRHGPMATRKRTAKDQGIVVATPRDPRSTRVIALLTQSASGTVPRVPRNTSFAVLIDGAHKQAMEILQRAVGDEKLHLERVLVELDDWFTQYVQRLSEAVRSLDVQQRAQRATVDGLSQVKLDVERTIGVHARMQAESLKRYQAAMQRMVTRTQAMAPVSERELRLGKEQDDYADDIPVLQACRVVLLKARVRALLTVLNAVQGNDCSASIVKRAASAAAEAQLGCLDIVAAQQEDRAVAITSTATQCPDPQALTELHRVLEACERAAVAAAQQAAAQRKAAAAQRVAQAQAKQNREMEAQEHFALRRRAAEEALSVLRTVEHRVGVAMRAMEQRVMAAARRDQRFLAQQLRGLEEWRQASASRRVSTGLLAQRQLKQLRLLARTEEDANAALQLTKGMQAKGEHAIAAATEAAVAQEASSGSDGGQKDNSGASEGGDSDGQQPAAAVPTERKTEGKGSAKKEANSSVRRRRKRRRAATKKPRRHKTKKRAEQGSSPPQQEQRKQRQSRQSPPHVISQAASVAEQRDSDSVVVTEEHEGASVTSVPRDVELPTAEGARKTSETPRTSSSASSASGSSRSDTVGDMRAPVSTPRASPAPLQAEAATHPARRQSELQSRVGAGTPASIDPSAALAPDAVSPRPSPRDTVLSQLAKAKLASLEDDGVSSDRQQVPAGVDRSTVSESNTDGATQGTAEGNQVAGWGPLPAVTSKRGDMTDAASEPAPAPAAPVPLQPTPIPGTEPDARLHRRERLKVVHKQRREAVQQLNEDLQAAQHTLNNLRRQLTLSQGTASTADVPSNNNAHRSRHRCQPSSTRVMDAARKSASVAADELSLSTDLKALQDQCKALEHEARLHKRDVDALRRENAAVKVAWMRRPRPVAIRRRLTADQKQELRDLRTTVAEYEATVADIRRELKAMTTPQRLARKTATRKANVQLQSRIRTRRRQLLQAAARAEAGQVAAEQRGELAKLSVSKRALSLDVARLKVAVAQAIDAKGKADTQRARTARAANSSELSSADAETSRLRQLRDLQAQLNWWKKRWDARQAAMEAERVHQLHMAANPAVLSTAGRSGSRVSNGSRHSNRSRHSGRSRRDSGMSVSSSHGGGSSRATSARRRRLRRTLDRMTPRQGLVLNTDFQKRRQSAMQRTASDLSVGGSRQASSSQNLSNAPSQAAAQMATGTGPNMATAVRVALTKAKFKRTRARTMRPQDVAGLRVATSATVPVIGGGKAGAGGAAAPTAAPVPPSFSGPVLVRSYQPVSPQHAASRGPQARRGRHQYRSVGHHLASVAQPQPATPATPRIPSSAFDSEVRKVVHGSAASRPLSPSSFSIASSASDSSAILGLQQAAAQSGHRHDHRASSESLSSQESVRSYHTAATKRA